MNGRRHDRILTWEYTRGFTLIELVIAMAIIGLLAALAYPAYNSHMTQTRRSDGQAALLDIMAKQERYYTENHTYTTDLSELPAKPTSKEGFYTISVSTCDTGTIAQCVQLTATPVSGGPQESDGPLTLNSRGQKTPVDKW